jgi:hypothetical protein
MFPAAHDGILDVAMTNMDFHHGPWQVSLLLEPNSKSYGPHSICTRKSAMKSDLSAIISNPIRISWNQRVSFLVEALFHTNYITG